METILLVGSDFPLLVTRAAVLENAGANVVCCDPGGFAERVSEARFALVVLCHTLKNDVLRDTILAVRRRWPGAPILQIVFGLATACEADASVGSGAPGLLVERVMEMLGRSPHGRRGVESPVRPGIACHCSAAAVNRR